MKESYLEGVAIHPDPESWVYDGNAMRQALTGAHAGEPLSREIRLVEVVDVHSWAWKTTPVSRYARQNRHLRGLRPSARMETPRTEIGGKGADQGKSATAKRGPDAEPGRPAKCAGTDTKGSRRRRKAEVHRALAPRCQRRSCKRDRNPMIVVRHARSNFPTLRVFVFFVTPSW